MNDETSNEAIDSDEGRELVGRRLFLQSMGKWSGAAIAAAVLGSAWIAFPPEAKLAPGSIDVAVTAAADGSTESVGAGEDG